MTTLRGRYFDGRSPAHAEVEVTLDGGMLRARPPLFEPVPLSGVRVSSRVGDTPRVIALPGGGVVESTDHATLDAWRAAGGAGRNLAHKLESRPSLAAVALATVAAIIVAGALWGVPWISGVIAHALPERVVATLGEGTLTAMDKTLFGATKLPLKRQAELDALFENLLPEGGSGLDYRLLYRDGGLIGANAFALPDGAVIVTDQLVELAGHDEEIAAVLLHEIGHVEHRHGLRLVISHVGLASLTVAVFGDVSAAGTMVLALPNVLMESSYSRGMEEAADTYALERMIELGIPPARFADLFERLAKTAPEAPTRYLSSHPPTPERIQAFRNPD